MARLPCLLFGPPPPAAPVIGAQAPSRPWPPRSSFTQASGSSSPCCARSLLVIFYTFEPEIASLHKENNIFFKKIMIFDPIYPPKTAFGTSPGGPDLDHFGRSAFHKCCKNTILLLLERRNVLLVTMGVTFSYNDKLTP